MADERAMVDNLALVKSAWDEAVRRDKPGNLQRLIDLLADDVVLRITALAGTPFGTEFRGKEAVVDFYTSSSSRIAEEIGMEVPLEYVDGGDRIVILGTEKYRVKKSRVATRNKDFAIVVDLRDGRIVKIRPIKDLSEVVRAYSA